MKKEIDVLDVRDEYERDENGNPEAGSTDGSECEVVGESFVLFLSVILFLMDFPGRPTKEMQTNAHPVGMCSIFYDINPNESILNHLLPK